MIQYLKELSDKGCKIYTFGAGKMGTRVFWALSFSGIRVSGVLDNAFPNSGVNDDIFIVSLDELRHCDRKNTYVVIGVQNGRNEVYQQLVEMGIENIIDYRDLATKRRESFPKLYFETSSVPQVSVLVTAYNEWQYTYNCLASLAEHRTDLDIEIILGDDNSTDETRNAEKVFSGVKVVHDRERLNYLGNVNNIAAMAKGKYILLLANDTLIIQDYWIDRMYRMMEADERIGMVSGKYWIPRLGYYDTAVNYTEDIEQEKLPQDACEQCVQFVGPVATMIRRDVWERVGGFSEEYLPAYYEDNDLCMKVISNGYKIIYTPGVETIHFENTSYTKTENIPKLLKEHKKLFRDKWGDTIKNMRILLQSGEKEGC